ncbi:CRISPR-associated endonuclease Cas2 [Bacteroides bouchesdurhonensis]
MEMTRKQLYVIAYDITDDHRRQQVVKLLEKIGVRINWSVFECMLTFSQIKKLKESLSTLLFLKEDTLVIYPICKNCYTKTFYLPENRRIIPKKVIVI